MSAAKRPLPDDTQAILDTALARASDEQRDRFREAADGHASAPAGSSARGALDLVGVAQLRKQLRSLVTAYDVMPSVSLLAPAAHCQAEIVELRSLALIGAVRRELYAAEAGVATLMGPLVWDASQRRDHATARQHFEHAVGVARQTRSNPRQARLDLVNAMPRRHPELRWGRCSGLVAIAIEGGGDRGGHFVLGC